MIVSKIEKRQGAARRFNVFTEGDEFAFCADGDTLKKHGIKLGADIDVAQMRFDIEDDEYQAAMERSYVFLESRMRAESEIESKLKTLGFTNRIIDRVKTRLKEMGYIDDELFAKLWAQQRIKSKSVRVVQGELIRKGIDREVVSEVKENADPALEVEKCVKIAQKYFARDIDEREAKRLASAALARRGYDWGTIRKAFDLLGQDTDDFDV